MKKCISNLLLAICLVVGLLPTVAYAVPEGNPLTNYILENRYKITEVGNEVYKLTGGKYHLVENISVGTVIYIGDYYNSANVTLDLNGYELKSDENTSIIFYLRNSSTLTLIDSSSAKTGKVISSSGRAVYLDYNCKLNANGGTVEGKVELSGNNAVIDNTDSLNITVFREGQISGVSSAVINGGIFYNTVNGYSGKIAGGTFYGAVNSGTIEDSAKVAVTFNSDGGTTVTEQSILRGQKASEPTAPTKTGYSFEGWYQGDTEFDFASTPVTENINLTAKWSVVWTELTQTSIENFKKYALGNYYYGLPSGNYYLGENILLDNYYIDIGSREPNANVTLDLNGFELRNDNSDYTLLFLNYNNALTLTDSSSGKTGRAVNSSWLAIDSRANSTLNANGGTVEGNVRILNNTTVIDNTDPSNVTVFTGKVENNGTIKGGIFYGTIIGSGTVSGVTYRRIVTFDSNGGSEVPSQDILKDDTATEPTDPTKAGYSFNGWYQANTEFDFANTPVTENITLTAKWSEKSDITFDTTPQSYTYNGSAQAFSITGTSVTGFDISYKQNGQIVINPTDAGSYDVIITRAEDNTYKAVDVTIRNGLVIKPKTVTATISAIPDETYTDNDIEPTITVYDDNTVIPASEYTVSYSDNRNAGTTTVTLTDKTGGNYNVSGTTTFEILPKSIDDAVITHNNTLTYNGTEQTQNVDVTLDGFDTVTFDISGDHQTDVNTNGDYTLTVTGNGNFTGSKNFNWNIAPATPTENAAKKTTARVIKNKTLADATVTYGEILALDGTTPLTGTFDWVDSTKVMIADGTEQMVFTPDNTNYALIMIDVAVSTYSTGGGGGSYTPSYTIKFETNGGTSIKNQSVVKNNKVNTPSNPTKEGYIFDGWYTDKKLTKKYDFDTKITGNLTLYAKWIENEEKFENPFNDISENNWFYEDVVYVYTKGLMMGTSATTFSPNGTTTRGMIVTILYRLAGSPSVSSSCPFNDVASNAYYKDATTWAIANGITSGYGDNKFGPNDPITREQFATFLYHYAKYIGYDVSIGEDTNILSYNDALNISEYAIPAMQWVCGEGVMQGSDGNLMPGNDSTRAQIAALLHRFCENVLNSK